MNIITYLISKAMASIVDAMISPSHYDPYHICIYQCPILCPMTGMRPLL